MTLELPRRSFLLGLGSLIAAPAIVRVSSLMPAKALLEPISGVEIIARHRNSLLTINILTKETIKLFKTSNKFLEDDPRFWVRFKHNDLHS